MVLPAIDELSDVSASHGLAAETMDDIVLADDIMPAITSFSASTVAMKTEHQLLLTTLAAALKPKLRSDNQTTYSADYASGYGQ